MGSAETRSISGRSFPILYLFTMKAPRKDPLRWDQIWVITLFHYLQMKAYNYQNLKERMGQSESNQITMNIVLITE